MSDIPRGKTIEDLRERLFDTIDGLKAGTVTVDKAKAISDLSQVIVNTARVEVDYLKANNGGESGFLNSAVGNANLPPGLPGPAGPGNGILGITRHTLRG